MSAILESAGESVRRDLTAITATWNHKPDFKVKVRIRGESAAVRVTTNDDVFHYLNEGTSVRYALMSKGWKSKTAPGRIRSGAGAGHLVLVSRKKPWTRSRKRWPRPGIKARGWMADVQRTNGKRFKNQVLFTIKDKLII